MKILHCADVHLASALETSLSPEKARTRRNELQIQFAQMIRYAQQNGVSCCIIAGDLFDASVVPARSLRYAFDLMQSASDICFFYLRGNHDRADHIPRADNIFVAPQTGQWQLFDMEDVTIAMCDPKEDDSAYPAALSLSPDRRNIVVLHGQVVQGGSTCGEQICLADFRGKHIDYMALGHIHSYRTYALDERGICCYSGCPEGRGFDECGQKGFVMLDVDESGIRHEFIPFSKRIAHDISVDISACETMHDAEETVLHTLEDVNREDMVRLTLTGACPAEAIHDISYLSQLLNSRFYAARVHDKTTVQIDPAAYQNDISLKGSFVTGVLQSDLDEEEKQRVLRLGLHLIMGGEANV